MNRFLILIIALFVAFYAASPTVAQNVRCYIQQGGAKAVASSGCEYEFQSGSTLDIQSGADVSFDDMPTFGSEDLYPLGYATQDQQIVCGTTDTFTGSTTITNTGLSTVTYVLATQVTAPASGGAFLHASDPTTSSFTLTSLEGDFTAGTTGVVAHYCVVGDQ